jgi:outer membrane protein OmpA-like peptidoglycan-associated protein
MRNRWIRAGLVTWVLLFAVAACHHVASTPVAQTPPPSPPPAPVPPSSVVVLLPDPEGKASSITITNAAGAQVLNQPYEAVHVDRANAAPGAPFTMDRSNVRTSFGPLLDALPAPEVSFLLYFGGASDKLTPESQAELPAILKVVRERHSNDVTVIGHTDTTGSSQTNYQLGLRRAQAVSEILKGEGALAEDIFIESHGDGDLLVKTDRGVDEPRNRRVEIIVR